MCPKVSFHKLDPRNRYLLDEKDQGLPCLLAVEVSKHAAIVLSAVVLLLSFLLLLFSAPVGLLLLGGPLVT